MRGDAGPATSFVDFAAVAVGEWWVLAVVAIDGARVVGFLAGPESDYLTGIVIPIDGGSTT
jgi:hypothetical protein